MLQSRCQGKIDGTVSGGILFRLTENSVLMDEISENIFNEELKLFLQKIEFRENFFELVRHGDPKFRAKKFRIRIIRVTA